MQQLRKAMLAATLGSFSPSFLGLLMGPCPPVGFPGFPCVFPGTSSGMICDMGGVNCTVTNESNMQGNRA